jgi:hypothetical protein
VREHSASLQRWSLMVLAALLVLLTGCLPGEPSTPISAVDTVSPEATVSVADPTKSTTDNPTPTASVAAPIAESPAAPSVQSTPQPTAGIAAVTPTTELPVEPTAEARAPDFRLTDLDGAEVSLSDLQGQVVLLNFWATW